VVSIDRVWYGTSVLDIILFLELSNPMHLATETFWIGLAAPLKKKKIKIIMGCSGVPSLLVLF